MDQKPVRGIKQLPKGLWVVAGLVVFLAVLMQIVLSWTVSVEWVELGQDMEGKRYSVDTANIRSDELGQYQYWLKIDVNPEKMAMGNIGILYVLQHEILNCQTGERRSDRRMYYGETGEVLKMIDDISPEWVGGVPNQEKLHHLVCGRPSSN